MSKNIKPEKLVEIQVYSWCLLNKFWIHVVESKATYSKNAKRYLRGNAPEGFPDMNGITPCLRPCYIELKAIGKRSNVSFEQTVFLLNAIAREAFAVVVDSPECLSDFYSGWRNTPDDMKAGYLFSQLPKKHIPMALQSISSSYRQAILTSAHRLEESNHAS